MVGLIIVIMFILSLSVFIKGVATNNENVYLGGVAMAFFFVIIPSVPMLINYSSAAKHQAIINKQAPIIAHYKDYIERLDVKINTSAEKGKQTIFTANHDTPVKSLVEAQLQAENQMLSASKARDEAHIKIEEIRLGVFGFVVNWVK